MTDTRVAPIDEFRGQLAHANMQKQLLNFLGQDEKKKMQFMAATVHVVTKIPDLLKCDRNTLMDALLTAAQLNLFPSAVSGEAYILPYKGKAQFQLGYQGLITLFYRAGVQSLRANIVYENDIFEYEEGLDTTLKHKPAVFGKKKGKAIGVYAVAVVNGQQIFKVMSEDEIMAYREFSQAKDSKYSPWNSDNDPDLWMWKKTCIKQLGKLLPKNESLMEAIGRDNEESTVALINDRKVIDPKLLKEGAPTIGSITKGKNEKSKGTTSKKGDRLFDVADNHSQDTGPEEPSIA